MEQTSFELTPKQKGILATLSRVTDKPVPALLDKALEALQEDKISDSEAQQGVASTPPKKKKRLWEIAADLFNEIPEEELAKLPVDGAAQHDHYIDGLPKCST